MAIFCRPPCAVVAATELAALLLVAPARAGAGVVWLYKPGATGDACATRLTTTTFSPDGRVQGVERLPPAARRRPDCFYVYPTVSDQPRPQVTRVVDDALRSIAHYQAARYTRDCRVLAPVYRRSPSAGWRSRRR
jgi:hypothetical protein